jgi:hypothetical protein
MERTKKGWEKEATKHPGAGVKKNWSMRNAFVMDALKRPVW